MAKMKMKVTFQVLRLWLMMMSDMVYRNFFFSLFLFYQTLL